MLAVYEIFSPFDSLHSKGMVSLFSLLAALMIETLLQLTSLRHKQNSSKEVQSCL